MAEVRVKRVDPGSTKEKHRLRKLYATLCYYYPKYSLKDAQAMPARDLHLLITTAQKIEAKRMYDLTQIVASPHTKNGGGVKQLLNFFKDRMKD